MLKEQQRLIRTGLFTADIMMIITAYAISYIIRLELAEYVRIVFPSLAEVSHGGSILYYLVGLVMAIASWLIALYYRGLYSSFRTRTVWEQAGRLIQAALMTFVLFGAITFVFKIEIVSRVFVGLFIVISWIFLLIGRTFILYISRDLRRKGINTRHILIVGTGARAKRLISVFDRHQEWGFQVVGLLDTDFSLVGQTFDNVKCLGILSDADSLLDHLIVDEVVIALPREQLVEVQSFVSVCETRGIRVSLMADIFNLHFAHVSFQKIDNIPLLSFETTPNFNPAFVLKRAMDIVISASALILLFPLFLIVAILIKLTSKGPVFFTQDRTGLNQRIFKLHKFRSMYADAQQRLESVRHLNEMDGPVFKITNDPRITPIGKWLRKFSIDELPQLWDVFMGHMSLVGPRPGLINEMNAYLPWQRRRMSMRPGLTCLWQIRGRNNLSFTTWMQLDLEYIDHWSLWLDIKILLLTIPAVIFAKGAR